MEFSIIREIRDEVLGKLDLGTAVPDHVLYERIEEAVLSHPSHGEFTASAKQQLVRRIFHSFRGLDILQPLIEDPAITEIMVNNHEEIFYERGGEMYLYDSRFESKEKLEDIIQTIVGRVNRVVNEASPIVDARLEDGSRVNVVLPPVALQGPTMTIRKFPETPLTMNDLVAGGMLTAEAAEMLRKLVIAKYNIFIGGGTGSGKTTFLNALAEWIPRNERIITIEDSAELQIRTLPNLVRMETRNANTEGKGEISMRDLIRTSLRMRPDRIIVGEVRGAEAFDMLAAMNTGHAGSLSTGHANSSKDMLIRLETMVLSGANLPLEVIRKQICSAIDILVHLSKVRDRSRKVLEICELAGMNNGDYVLNPLFLFEEEDRSPDGKVTGKLKATGNRLLRREKWNMAGLHTEGSGDVC